MSLMQKAVETYNAHAHLAGLVQEGHQPLAPVAHTITSAAVEITLDSSGNLVNMRAVSKDEPKIIIPVTEGSAGRSIKPCPHPLCEQIGYLSGENPVKFQLYTEQLERWASSVHSHPMLAPILHYVRSGTLLRDLDQYGIKKDDKALVRWRVNGLPDDQSSACWMNRELFRAFTAWYLDEISERTPELCMISGETDVPAAQHPKGIIPIMANAKLISANDSSGFTFRGRFTEDTQAATVSYVASQKAHNALRWLASEQGVITQLGGPARPQRIGGRVVFGGRTFLCWNPKGKPVPSPSSPLPLFISVSEPAPAEPTSYREALRRTLNGFLTELPENCGGVVIAAFDAATAGRLSITYYNELRASDFLHRLYQWDELCCWWNWDAASGQYTIQSPSLWRIMNCAFGTQRSAKQGSDKSASRLETDERIARQQMQRLLACRVNGAAMPEDIKRALVNRASSPQSYDSGIYADILFAACAVIRKYHYEHSEKEKWPMALEKSRKDRSYQFGRLLAVLEKIERDTYRDDEKREPNALRLMSVYRSKPLHTACQLQEKICTAYLPRLKPGVRVYYQNLIQEIMTEINSFPQSAWNARLDDSYLMGYYLQRRELYQPKQEKEQEEK